VRQSGADQPSKDASSRVKNAPLSDQVTAKIRELILNGELQPGVRIGQEALAERFGTSRIPVRDALRQLESEGLVLLIPNSSARVAKLDVAECSEIYQIRERIEPFALAESIPHMSEEDIVDLERATEELERTVDSDVFLKLDREFHLSSYQAAEMPRLKALIERYWNTTQHYRRAYTRMVWEQGNWIINYEHRLLMEAIRRRDVTDAGQILMLHIRRTRQGLVRHMELFPESRSTSLGSGPGSD
jgi:DNA-binding GntR family transcriptional regulator